MKLQRVLINENHFTWLVLGKDYLPIEPIQSFIRYLENIERSPHTIRAYANHLKLYWEYLEEIKKDWKQVKLDDFAGFINWLRVDKSKVIYLNGHDAKRMESTINSILTATSSFYTFHHQLGNTEVTLVKTASIASRRYKSLLYHITKNSPARQRLVKLKQPKHIPKTITIDQVKTLIDSCNNWRDKFLVSLLYETGMRIGQALGLRHTDIKSWDNEIHIIPRINNINGSRAKTSSRNIIHVSPALMTIYSRFITEDCENIESEYVFVQIKKENPGKPLSYRTVRDLFCRLSKKLGIHITPHMLRHTHATELIRDGWDASFVQKRLGHSSVQTTIDNYSHLSSDDMKKAFKKYHDSKTGGQS
jgi:integrase